MADPVNARDFGRLEERVETLSAEVSRLTETVHELTGVLQQTKGGWKLILMTVGVASSLSAAIGWIATHVNFK